MSIEPTEVWNYNGNRNGIVKNAAGGIVALCYGTVDAIGNEVDTTTIGRHASIAAAAPDLLRAARASLPLLAQLSNSSGGVLTAYNMTLLAIAKAEKQPTKKGAGQ